MSGERVRSMHVRLPRGTGIVAGGLLVFALAACQGNIGSGSGLSIPQAAAPYQPGGPGQAPSSRERALEGAVYLSASSPAPTLPLPTIGGFGIAIDLGTPGPSPSPVPSATASPGGKKLQRRTHASAIGHRSYSIAFVAPAAGASPAPASSDVPLPATPGAASATGSSSASPTATTGSAAPSGVTHLSDVPSPGASGSPGPAGSGVPLPSGSASPAGHHHTHPAINSGPKIVTKTVAYPDDAPAAPTPEPTGNVQTFPVRTALVRGYIMPAVDVPIYGLGAIKFIVPKSELTTTRGYTIAVFTAAKKHRGKLLEYDTSPTVGVESVASVYQDDPIVFKKNIGYEIVLYADPGLATPVPLPSGSYPNAGVNPVPYPSGLTPPPGSGQTPVPPGYPTPPPGSTPYPTQTFFH